MEYGNFGLPLLIEKCVQKDPVAWAEFVKRFSSLITFSLKRALAQYSFDPGASGEELKDIKQDILFSLWEKDKLSEVKNKKNINYWLAIISRNAVINYLKGKQKNTLVKDKGYFDSIPAKKTIKRGDHDARLSRIDKLLSTKEKIIFKFYFEKKFALKDISKIMSMPIGTVSSAVTRMRKKIKCSKI